MYKVILLALGVLIISLAALKQTVRAEDIHFNNNVFTLKYSAMSAGNKGYENEYFLKGENKNNHTKMIGIYYYPEISNPIKFADKTTKEIEAQEINVLLKFIQNKKTDRAALSYLQNGECSGKNYFEYIIIKYEKHPDKGIMELKYSIRYFCSTNDEIIKMANKVKEENDEFLQMIIESPIPPIIEKDININ